MSCGGRAAVVYDARCKRCGAAGRVTRVRYVEGPVGIEGGVRIEGECSRCGYAGELDAWYGWCQDAPSKRGCA